MTDTQHSTERFLKLCGEDREGDEFVRDLLSRLGDKWSILVISTLASGPLRFTELQRATDGISHRMLSVTLRALVTDGLVSRESFDEVPPRVEYALTPLGNTLLGPVLGLIDWASEHQLEVEANRKRDN
jgi:DNA-binding HxlR family transcriptional regulator